MASACDTVINNRYKELAAAIVRHACEEYTSVLGSLSHQRAIMSRGTNPYQIGVAKKQAGFLEGKKIELERFFLSNQFQLLCSDVITGKSAIREMRKQVRFIPNDDDWLYILDNQNA